LAHPFTLAVTYGQLGELELAGNALRELLAIRPSFAATARVELEKWLQTRSCRTPDGRVCAE
jgi:hypothetical protein